MTPYVFNEVVENRIQKIKSILQKKALEYSTVGDRFHNFKVAASANTTTVPKALFGMFMKHYVSIKDIVDAYDTGNEKTIPSRELLDEKIGDAINYLILLEGIMTEIINKQKPLEIYFKKLDTKTLTQFSKELNSTKGKKK